MTRHGHQVAVFLSRYFFQGRQVGFFKWIRKHPKSGPVLVQNGTPLDVSQTDNVVPKTHAPIHSERPRSPRRSRSSRRSRRRSRRHYPKRNRSPRRDRFPRRNEPSSSNQSDILFLPPTYFAYHFYECDSASAVPF